jgi:hypothetical protein
LGYISGRNGDTVAKFYEPNFSNKQMNPFDLKFLKYPIFQKFGKYWNGRMPSHPFIFTSSWISKGVDNSLHLRWGALLAMINMDALGYLMCIKPRSRFCTIFNVFG